MFRHRLLDRRSKRSRGVVTAELLLTLPLIVLLGAFLVGLVDLVIAEQKLDEASGRAGRIVALGGSEQDVRTMLDAFWGPERARYAQVTITPLNQPGISPSTDSFATEIDAVNFADAPVARTQHRELIEVRIELDVRRATVTKLVPLGRDEKLIGRTVVSRH